MYGHFTSTCCLSIMIVMIIINLSHDMGFPTMMHLRPAKAQTSQHIRAVWSEPLLVAWIFYDCKATDRTAFGISNLKRRLHLLVWVYSCQNVTLLEISCRGSYLPVLQYAYRNVVKSSLKDTSTDVWLSLVSSCPSGNIFFLVYEEWSLEAGHKRPARETPFKWRFAGMPIMALRGMLAW